MRKRRSREQWAEEVRKWRASGLTRREYGQQSGVSPGQLSWWRWRLGAQIVLRPARRRSRGAVSALVTAASRRPSARATFVEARLVEQASAPVFSGAEAAECGELEIVAGRPHVVRVRAGFDAALLRRVLSVLEGC